jgi:hypothetical protein
MHTKKLMIAYPTLVLSYSAWCPSLTLVYRPTNTIRLKLSWITNSLLNLFVIIQAFLLASKNVSIGAIVLGWLLFFAYFFHLIIISVASDASHRTAIRIDWLLNTVFFFALAVLGRDTGSLPQVPLYILLAIQAIRIAKLFIVLKYFKLFKSIVPVSSRAILLYGLLL